jgi:Spy/CpxP family protein refolding chaperone
MASPRRKQRRVNPRITSMPPGFSRRGLATVLALAAALWASPADADAGQHKAKWWRSEVYQRELGLTVDQATRIEHIFQESWPSLQESKKELDRLETELSQVIAEGTAEESRVLKMIDRVEASRSTLARTRALMLYRIHRVLSPAQRTRLKALHEEQNRTTSGEHSR